MTRDQKSVTAAVARTTLLVGGFTIIARLIGFAKEMAVASRYGVSPIVDAYNLAFAYVSWSAVAIVSVITSVFVPHFVRLRSAGLHADRIRFEGEANLACLIVGSGLAAVAFWLCPMLISRTPSMLSQETIALASQMSSELFMVPLAMVLSGLLAARIIAAGGSLNALLEGVPPAAILGAAVYMLDYDDGYPLVFGTIFGFCAQAMLLGVVASRIAGRFIFLNAQFEFKDWGPLRLHLAVMLLSQLAISLIAPIDQYAAAQLGDGSSATLGYASRIVALLSGVAAIALSRAILPVLSHLVATGNDQRARRESIRWALLMFACGMVVNLIGFPASPLVVKILFERGAFDAATTSAVAYLLQLSLVQLPFFFAGMVLVQLLAARGRFVVLAVITVASVCLKAVLNAILPELLGLPAIVLSTAAMYALNLVLLLVAAVRNHARPAPAGDSV